MDEQILQRIKEPLLAFHKEGNMVYANEAANAMLGILPGNAGAGTAKQLCIELFGDLFCTVCETALQLQQHQSFEHHFDHSGRWMEINVYPSLNGMTILCKDISSLKEREAVIRRSEKRYQALIENHEGIISLIDENVRMLFRNASAERLTGWSNAEAAGIEHVHPDDKEYVKGLAELSLKNPGKEIPVLFRLQHKNGSYIWLEGSMTNRMDDEDIRGIFTNLRDVSKRIDAEQKLQAAKALADQIINSLPGIFYMADEFHRLLKWNKAFETIVGYTGNELRLLHSVSVIAKEDQPAFLLAMEKAYKDGSSELRLHLQDKHGHQIPFYFTGVKIEFEGRPAILGTGVNISELEAAETAIRISNERFLLAATATNDLIWDWNLDTNELWWNSNYNRLFGYDETVVHSIDEWVDHVHPDDRVRVKEGIYRVVESGGMYWSDEYRYMNNEGTYFNIFDRGYVARNEDGKAFRMIGSMLNMTDRILAEKAIKDSEEKYRTLVEQAADAIYIANLDGRIITANPTACKLSGYTEAELLQMSVYDFVFAEDLMEMPFQFEPLKEGKTVIIERRLKVKNGLVIPMEFTAKMLSDGRILVFARDITERLKAQQEILKEKILSDSIINSLPGIFYLFNEKGRFIRWNKNFEVISGFTMDEVKMKTPIEFFDKEEVAMLLAKGEEVFSRGQTDVEAHFVTKYNQRIPFYFTGWRIIFEGEPCLIGVGIDITQKRKAEEMLRKSYEEIRGLAAHLVKVRDDERKRIGREIHDELGQRLTAVKMDVAWIDKKTAEEATLIKAKLRNIISLLDGSNLSVRRILNELNPIVLDHQGLPEAMQRLNQQFEASTGIVIDMVDNDLHANIPQDVANCIFRVYQESLTNIMRYAKATKVAVYISVEDKTCSMSVADNGEGFDTALEERKNAFGILGMKERVLSLRGTFDLISARGKGTKIIVKLPLEQ